MGCRDFLAGFSFSAASLSGNTVRQFLTSSIVGQKGRLYILFSHTIERSSSKTPAIMIAGFWLRLKSTSFGLVF